MSKIENKWDNLSEWEKQKVYDDLSRLIRIKQQKDRVNKIPVEKRITDIKRKFIRGRI
ncbi:MAG: hypothetical protein ACFE9S_15590 [Candidatus Hermodarchaeota archaeon]